MILEWHKLNPLEVETEWLARERKQWDRLEYACAISGRSMPWPGFPTALTEEEPDEGVDAFGGVEVLYMHGHTSLRFIDPFRIVDHALFRKQVYPDLHLSAWYPAREINRQIHGRTYNPRDVRISFGGVEFQGFADVTFVAVERATGVVATAPGAITASSGIESHEWAFDLNNTEETP